MYTRAALLAAAMLATLLPLRAQESKDGGPLYRVEVNFREGNDSGALTDRRYTLLVTDSKKVVFKVGSRTPAVSGSLEPPASGSMVSTQFTYLDVGVNIQCTLHAVGGKVAINGSLDMSNIDGASAVAGVHNPIVKQTRLDLEAVVELGKPTVVASIDDPLTTRKLQVEVTVSKAN
jgi:hypothetical protein